MEAEQTFQLYLIKYQGVHLSNFITFMMHFRIIVNGVLPTEIIVLHTETEKRIVELLTKVLPHHYPLDIPCFRAFASFESKYACPVTTWSRRLPKEKGPLFKFCGLSMPNPNYTVRPIRLGNDMVPKS
ncbi:hypothetical protein TNCV_1708571 [Trichonephila clavipes]|nr:hypothetical protein TNCV_1708571 [Trichonephila clavipes]